MSNVDVKLVFGVQGGGSLSGASGKEIKTKLTAIINQLKPKIKLSIDETSIRKELKRVQGIFKKELFNFYPTTKTNTNNSGSSKSNKNSEESRYLKEQNQQLKAWNDEIKKAGKIQQEMFKVAGNQGSAYYEGLNKEAEKLNKKLSQIGSGGTGNLAQKRVAELKNNLNKNELALQKELTKSANSYNKVVTRIGEYIERTDVKTEEGRQAIESLRRAMEAPIAENMDSLSDPQKLDAYNAKIKELNALLLQTSSTLHKTGAIGQTVGAKFKKALSSKFFQAVSASVIAFASRAMSQVYHNVLDIDQAVTNLQIATGKTRLETEKLVKSYAKLSKELGSTVTDVTNAADTWLRQGYDIAETEQLIANTMMLSKLGQLDSAEAAKNLTSAMKGYKVSVEESMGIVDKFTAVDMKAAISAGDIATAMAETATSADIAGVSMDSLIGYIATVGEVTQDSAESVGTFFKTMFARMGNVKAGVFIDDETGESLNDVEKVLSSLGIALRNQQGEFRDFGQVLDEVAAGWDNYDNIQQHAIATAMAGTRQQEKFLTLMENYGTASSYAMTAANSAGTAQEKYQAAYLDSIDAKLNTLKGTWQAFSANILDSDLIKTGVDFLSGIASVLNGIVSAGDGALVKIAAIVTISMVLTKQLNGNLKSIGDAFTNFFTNFKGKAASFMKTFATAFKSPMMYLTVFVSLIQLVDNSVVKAVLSIITVFTVLGLTIAAVIKGADSAIRGFMTSNPIGWILLAVMALIEGIKALDQLIMKNSFANLKEAAEKSKEAWQETADALKEVEDALSSVNDKIQEYTELEKERALTADERAELALLKQQQSTLESEQITAEENEDRALKKSAEDTKAALDKWKEKKEGTYEDYNGWQKAGRWTLGILTLGLSEIGFAIADAAKDTNQERAEAALQNYKNASEEEKAFLDEYISEINSLTDGYEYAVVTTDHPALSEAEVEVNRLLDMSYDLNEKKAVAAGKFDVAWQSTINRIKYDDSVAKLKALAESFELTDESMQSFVNDPANAEFVNHLKDIGLYGEDGAYGIHDLALKVKDLGKFIGETSKKSLLDIIDGGLEGAYNSLKQAQEDMEEFGIISMDTIRDLQEEFPELWASLQESGTITLGKDGYTLGDNSLNGYLENLRTQYKNTVDAAQEYYDKVKNADPSIYGDDIKTALTNLENATANYETLEQAISIMQRADLVEDYKDMLEEQSEALEAQKDKYKDIIDMRKELLETYADEIKKQKELEQKQQNVADLQTKLRLAQLDTSASGQARARELEEELKDAQEDLSEYTLEQAIEELTSNLDEEYKQMEDSIERQTSAITEAIENAANMSTAQLREALGLSSVGDVPEHHTGGFVGNIKPLKSNEEFAKLLNGELVVTPVQMSNFMNKTLPGMTSGVSGVVNYNSPLITINCDNVSKDSLPGLENIVNKAVKKIKEQIDSKFSRNGKKGSIDAFII